MDQYTSRQNAVPGPLWVVIGAFLVVAACLLYPTIALLRLAGALFSLSPALGLVGLAVAGVTASFVVAFARVAHGLYDGSRVARGLAFVLAGYLLLACFAVPVATGLAIALALGSLGVVAVLVTAPSARAWFAGPWGRGTTLPTSIVVAQTAVLYSSGITALLAATLVVGGLALVGTPYVSGIAGLMVVGGLVCAGIAGVGFWARSALARGERRARVLVTAATVADLLVVLLLSGADTSVFPLLASFGLHCAVVVALWLPADARRFFGDAALPAIENLHRQALELGRGPSVTPVPPPAPTRPGPPPSAPWPAPPRSGPPSPRPSRPAPASPPLGTPSPLGPPSGRHARPDLTDPATTGPAGSAAPAFCSRCGSGAVPGAVHCVRCGARLVGYGAPEPQP